MDIITRQEAKERGLIRYFTGKPCKHGHVAERFVANKGCMECMSAGLKEWRKANPERARELKTKWRKNNIIKHRESNRKCAQKRLANDPEGLRSSQRKWREANREHIAGKVSKWGEENRHKRCASQAKRRSLKLSASPSWLTPEHHAEIEKMYSEAWRATKLTGVEHHVDLIEALQGKDRCGLHVHWNLQVLSAFENISKGNRTVRHFHWKKV